MTWRYSAHAEKLMIALIICHPRNSKIGSRASCKPVILSLEWMIGTAAPIIHSRPLLSQPFDRLSECHIEFAHVGR
jgi:hypothetical protein